MRALCFAAAAPSGGPASFTLVVNSLDSILQCHEFSCSVLLYKCHIPDPAQTLTFRHVSCNQNGMLSNSPTHTSRQVPLGHLQDFLQGMAYVRTVHPTIKAKSETTDLRAFGLSACRRLPRSGKMGPRPSSWPAGVLPEAEGGTAAPPSSTCFAASLQSMTQADTVRNGSMRLQRVHAANTHRLQQQF